MSNSSLVFMHLLHYLKEDLFDTLSNVVLVLVTSKLFAILSIGEISKQSLTGNNKNTTLLAVN